MTMELQCQHKYKLRLSEAILRTGKDISTSDFLFICVAIQCSGKWL